MNTSSNAVAPTSGYKFFYTKTGSTVNSDGKSQPAMVDTGCSVELFLDDKQKNLPKKKLDKAMIERFTNYNGGSLPTFRTEFPTAL